jgi:DNA-binding MarR family transcriptional regulator
MHPDIPLGAIVSVIHRTHYIVLNNRMKELGLSAGQLFTLVYLSKKQGVTQDAMATFFHIDKATIARTMKKLEDRGFIRRITDQNDRRAVQIFLTESGSEIVPEVIRIDREWEAGALNGLNSQEQEQARSLLVRIAENSHAMAHGTGEEGHE